MPLNIRSEEVNRLAQRLAARKRLTKTEVVKQALQNELRREEQNIPLSERLQPLRETIAALPDTGEKADKEFFDELSGGY